MSFSETYEVLFDGNPVAVEEITPGVLRCVCPGIVDRYLVLPPAVEIFGWMPKNAAFIRTRI